MQHTPTDWEPGLEHAALTDVGLRRANNQDSMSVVMAGSRETWRRRGHLFIVADGMGAHAAGELASKMAVDTVGLHYSKLTDLPPAEALVRATEDANAQINQRGESQPEFRGMGTTCTSLLLLPNTAMVVHVGDSRAYRLRDECFEQLTFDHSLVWELRAAGHFPEDEVPDYVPRNIITRSLGPNPQTQVDLEGPFPVKPGDTFLLCSDGLSGQVEDEEIGAILATMAPDEAAQSLVDLAKLRGGPDNITTVIVRVGDSEAPATSDTASDPSEGSAGSLSKQRLADEPTVRRPAREVHPALWTTLGIVALGAGVCAGMQLYPLAAICLVAAIVTSVVILILRQPEPEPASMFESRPSGKGPYSQSTAAVNAAFVEQLGRIAEELRTAAASSRPEVDDVEFERRMDDARAAAKAGDHASSIGSHLHAIRFMMSQLRSTDDGDREPPVEA